MSNKQLINNVVLNIDSDSPYDNSCIEMELVIPIKLEEKDLEKFKGKESVDLGTIEFSKETSELIRQVAETMRKELLSQL